MAVEVSEEVLAGINWVMRLGVYNPYNFPSIVAELRSAGMNEAAYWVEHNPNNFQRGIDSGFKAIRDDYGDEYWIIPCQYCYEDARTRRSRQVATCTSCRKSIQKAKDEGWY